MGIIRQLGFYLMVIAALAGGTWAYFQLRKSKSPPIEAISLLPDEALVYVNSNDVFSLHRKLSARSMAVDGLRSLKPVHVLCGALRQIDSLSELSAPLREQLDGNTLHLAFYGKKKLNWLFCFNLKSQGDAERLLTELKPLADLVQMERDLYSIGTKLIEPAAFLRMSGGVVLISDSEDLLRQSEGGSLPKLRDSESFRDYKLLHPDGQLLSVYTNHNLYTAGGHCEQLDLSLICNTGISGMDIEPATSEIRMNGFLKPGPEDTYAVFATQQPYPTSGLLTKLPATVNAFRAFALDTFVKLVSPDRQIETVANFWKAANDSAMFNVEKAFMENAGGCLSEFSLRDGSDQFLLLDVKDTVLSREQLGLLSDTLLRTGIACYRLPVSLPLFMPVSKNLYRYVLIHNSALYFTSGRSSALELSGILQQNDVLATSKSFMAYSSENISETFNFVAYCSPRSSTGLISELLSADRAKTARDFEKFRHFSYSIVNTGLLRTRMHLLYSSEQENESSGTLWTMQLDTISYSVPARFINYRTGENEILVQDVANTLYLFTAKGELRWKKKLTEKVISPIHNVDALKNNKFQMLFNTAGAIHLIDRAGHYVEGYPLRLKASATNALGLFDYENNKDYRILIACSDRRIYNYAIDGSNPATFESPATDAKVRLPVQYCDINGKEYLVALDENGKIYGFNRRGQIRTAFSNSAVAGCSAFWLDVGRNEAGSYIVYLDEKNALLNKISFADKKEMTELRVPLPAAGCRFDLADNNRYKDLVLWGASQVMAFDLGGNLIYKRPVPGTPAYAGFYRFTAKRGAYIYCEKEGILWLHDRETLKLSSYRAAAPPLICDLFRNKESYMVFIQDDQLICAGF